MASAFVEVPQSLNISKEPFSTSVENVSEPTNKTKYFRLLSYLFSEKELLQYNIEELMRLQKRTFCFDDGFHEDFVIEGDLNLHDEGQDACNYIADSISSNNNGENDQIPYQINAQQKINQAFSEALNNHIHTQEADSTINFNKLSVNDQLLKDQNHKITSHDFNKIERDCYSLLTSINYKEIHQNNSQKIDKIHQLDLHIDIPQELVEKLQKISKYGIQQSLQTLSDISTTKENIEKAQNVINKLSVLVKSNSFIPSEVSDTAESIRRELKLVTQTLSSITKRALRSQAIKGINLDAFSRKEIESKQPLTVDVLDQNQVEETKQLNQEVQELFEKQLENQKQKNQLLKSNFGISQEDEIHGEESSENNNDDFDFTKEINEINQIVQNIHDKHNEQIALLSHCYENIDDSIVEAMSEITNDTKEDNMGADDQISENDQSHQNEYNEIDIKLNQMLSDVNKIKLPRNRVYKVNGIEDFNVKQILDNIKIPDYHPGVEVVETFMGFPENQYVSSVKSHFFDFKESITNDDDPIVYYIERKENLEFELDNLEKELHKREREVEKARDDLKEETKKKYNEMKEQLAKHKDKKQKISSLSDKYTKMNLQFQQDISSLQYEVKKRRNLITDLDNIKKDIDNENERIKKEKEIEKNRKRDRNKDQERPERGRKVELNRYTDIDKTRHSRKRNQK